MHLDTHVVAWLFAGHTNYLPAAVRRRLDSEPLVISPIVELELAYLHEIGQTSQPPGVVLQELGAAVGLTVSGAPFGAVVGAAIGLVWTRDPFDRLIAAQALTENETLLTKNERIRKHLELAVWDAS
ncbi:MAG: type II toxin-antitoxin system VapC family toxin [Pseudonocardiaceae bacterium]